MENINESRNSIRTYIQSSTQHICYKKKLKIKTLTFEQKKQLFTKNKKRNIKSHSLLALRADVCKYRPEVGKTKFLKKPKKIM